MSRHHSITFPCTSWSPKALGRNDPIGAGSSKPSSSHSASAPPLFPPTSAALARFAKPFKLDGVAPLDHGVTVPARAAYSHCASLGNARPSCAISVEHSVQLTFPTGCRGAFNPADALGP